LTSHARRQRRTSQSSRHALDRVRHDAPDVGARRALVHDLARERCVVGHAHGDDVCVFFYSRFRVALLTVTVDVGANDARRTAAAATSRRRAVFLVLLAGWGVNDQS